MSDWLKLEHFELHPKQRVENVQGVEVRILASPHNVPEAVRGFFDKSKDRFAIEFKYLDDEEKVSAKSNLPEATFYVGKNSSRLWRIEIDVKALKAKQVTLTVETPKIVEQGLRMLQSKPQAISIEQNYELATEAIERKKDQLFEPLHV